MAIGQPVCFWEEGGVEAYMVFRLVGKMTVEALGGGGARAQ